MKKIVYLDDDKSLCYLMNDVLQECGAAEIITINSFFELQKLEASIHNYDIVFLDVNLGNNLPNGIDAYKWLMDRNFDKRVIFFTGHANSYPLVQNALLNPKVAVLEKPATIEAIRTLVES